MLIGFLVFFPMAASVLAYLVGRRSEDARDALVILSCLLEAAGAGLAVAAVLSGRALSLSLPACCAPLTFALDGFRAMYACVAGVMWLATGVLSKEYFAHHGHDRNRYYFFNLMTLGATMGVFLSADLLTTFIFFEVMSFTSYPWVAHEETPEALRAAQTYLAVAILGGMVMLMGLFVLYLTLGTLEIAALYGAAQACPSKGALWAAGLCMLVGFGAKAGMFPLHIWLPKAHPVAPAPASALLSGILTKSGVFGVIAVTTNIFRESAAWGNMLLVLALVTMLGGAVLAVFSVNLKRTLACSSMSQIGFILTGLATGCLLGPENALAERGALLYMLNHSLFKLVLFMAAGVVYMNLHKLDLNDVRGYGRRKPLLHFAFLMGAVGLMGVPGFSGYVSKTLIHEGLVEYIELVREAGGFALPYQAAEWVYLFSGGLTGAYMIKLYICLFWQKHPTEQVFHDANRRYMKPMTALALTLTALLVLFFGLTPNLTMDAIADFADGFLHAGTPEHDVHYFSLTNLRGADISLVIGLLVYLLVIRTLLMGRDEHGARTYLDLWPKRLDIEDAVYRPAIGAMMRAGGALAHLCSEKVLETHIYKPAIAAASRVGSLLAGGLSEKTLETFIYKPVIAGASFVGLVLAKAVSETTDMVAVLADETVLRVRHAARRLDVGGRVAQTLGGFADGVSEGLNHTVRRASPVEHHFTGKLAGLLDGLSDMLRSTTHTMSYGLILFGLGLCATLLYLLMY